MEERNDERMNSASYGNVHCFLLFISNKDVIRGFRCKNNENKHNVKNTGIPEDKYLNLLIL